MATIVNACREAGATTSATQDGVAASPAVAAYLNDNDTAGYPAGVCGVNQVVGVVSFNYTLVSSVDVWVDAYSTGSWWSYTNYGGTATIELYYASAWHTIGTAGGGYPVHIAGTWTGVTSARCTVNTATSYHQYCGIYEIKVWGTQGFKNKMMSVANANISKVCTTSKYNVNRVGGMPG